VKLEKYTTENTNNEPGLRSCGFFFGKGEQNRIWNNNISCKYKYSRYWM